MTTSRSSTLTHIGATTRAECLAAAQRIAPAPSGPALAGERADLWHAVCADLCPTLAPDAAEHLWRARLVVAGACATVIAENAQATAWMRHMLGRSIRRAVERSGAAVLVLEFSGA